MTKYLQRQRLLIKYYEALVKLPDFIREIILKRPSYNPLYVQIFEDDSSLDTKDVAKSFNYSCYSLMTNDYGRMDCYRRLISEVSEVTTQSNWLEIGPGKDACLGLMVLDVYLNAKYIGIEVNKMALKSAKQILSKYSNASVYYGFIDENFTKFPLQVDYILHEIFGVIASSEGAAKVMLILRKRYPMVRFVPNIAQTYIAPLSLDVTDIISQNILTINHKLFRGVIPFTSQMTQCHALLEAFDFNSISDQSLKQCHKTKCKINKDGFVTVLGIYIQIGSESTTTTSNHNIPGYSSNWANVGLVLPCPIEVKKNKTLIITSNVDLSVTPRYDITISYEKYSYNWNISYQDLYGSYQYLHTIAS